MGKGKELTQRARKLYLRKGYENCTHYGIDEDWRIGGYSRGDWDELRLAGQLRVLLTHRVVEGVYY